jgi:hypothetical protein
MRTKLLKTIIACSVLSISLDTTSLRDAVEQTINTNPDIIAEHFKKKATKLNNFLNPLEYIQSSIWLLANILDQIKHLSLSVNKIIYNLLFLMSRR